MALPTEFKRVRLTLARSKQFPEGSNQHGYEFIVPLDAKDHIDTVLWRTHREACRVHRFWYGRMKRWVKWFISPEAKSTPAESLTTIETESTMTRQATALVRTPSSRVNTSRSAIRMMRIRSASFPWSQQPDCYQSIATQ
jgi:hypothetical protein